MVVRKRLALAGPALFFVTTTVVDWLPVFSNQRLAIEATKQLGESATQSSVSVCAYVIMPSHLHALLGFHEARHLSEFMKAFKRETARRIREHLPAELKSRLVATDGYRLWKPRFDDLVVWSEKQFSVKAEYIHNNPVKAHLVGTAVDYPYSSARQWLTNESGEVPIVRDWTWA